MPDRRPSRMIAALALALGLCTAFPGAASAASRPAPGPAAAVQVPGPFTEPSFAATCTWHSFGEGEQPPWWLALQNPLCVEYSKRDITFDNGGALRFLLAEPSRFAVALLTCRYYQKDHWSVQATTGAVPYVQWDGQYWWDRTARHAGARLTHFRVDGTPVGIGDAVAALRPRYPEIAEVLATYGEESGESGTTVGLGFDLACATAG
ncbi:hypothetical protein [Kitasatospora sp. NPDC094015]|uniref:hypothetical protein n=1 Tax=Kitasatospora sp. NPDC094015 TaxID=3155205 RepID=UPI0033329510